MDKPKCYDCHHRRDIPADAHSRCVHPEIKKTGFTDDWFTGLAEAFVGKADPARVKLGIRGGGQTWPANFNPVFLVECEGFEKKKKA